MKTIAVVFYIISIDAITPEMRDKIILCLPYLFEELDIQILQEVKLCSNYLFSEKISEEGILYGIHAHYSSSLNNFLE